MDNNFSKILDIFKSLDESNQFAGQAVGQKPGEQWRGTDAGTPGKKLVGASESVEQECEEPVSLGDKLRARWEETKRAKGLTEYGATGAAGSEAPPGQPNQSQNPEQTAADLKQTQKSLQDLKSKVPGINVAKATAALTKTDADQPLSNMEKDAGLELAPAVADLVKNPQLNTQFKQLIDKSQQMQKQQQSGTQ